jgi:predicted transposase YbfD/YdcC
VMEVLTLTVTPGTEPHALMAFSSMSAVRRQCLLDLLGLIEDPRQRRGRHHSLVGLLAVSVAAAVGGASSFAAIAQWARNAGSEVLGKLRAERGPAEESTFRRVLAKIDADRFDTLLGLWLWTRTTRVLDRLVIAIDGKTVRGAKAAGGKVPHLVAALVHGVGTVIGQNAVDDKTNEIPTVRDLLRRMVAAGINLVGTVITVDAMHTQAATARLIREMGADYVMCAKANMPTLHRKLKKTIPWNKIQASSTDEASHGRKTKRSLKVVAAPEWIEFPDAAQVAQIRRTRTSNAPVPPDQSAQVIRGGIGRWQVGEVVHRFDAGGFALRSAPAADPDGLPGIR